LENAAGNRPDDVQSGNVSGLDPGKGPVVIKPSGVNCAVLRQEAAFVI